MKVLAVAKDVNALILHYGDYVARFMTNSVFIPKTVWYKFNDLCLSKFTYPLLVFNSKEEIRLSAVSDMVLNHQDVIEHLLTILLILKFTI